MSKNIVMEFDEVADVVGGAWIEFYHHLSRNGLSEDQINDIDLELDAKDVFSSVIDVVMGATGR